MYAKALSNLCRPHSKRSRGCFQMTGLPSLRCKVWDRLVASSPVTAADFGSVQEGWAQLRAAFSSFSIGDARVPHAAQLGFVFLVVVFDNKRTKEALLTWEGWPLCVCLS